MNITRDCIIGLMTLMVCSAVPASGEPKPSPTPIAWELKFKSQELARIDVDTGKGVQTFWYMLYTVTNQTGEDVDFNPEVVRVSEIDEASSPAQPSAAGSGPALLVEEAVVGVHPKVFEAIKKLYAKTQPFLISPVEAIGKLRQGADNALTSVVVFPALDPRVSKFTIYFSGLSGERITMPNPSYDPKRPSAEGKPVGQQMLAPENPKFFVLRKTLAMPFVLPGDAASKRHAKPVMGQLGWVMR